MSGLSASQGRRRIGRVMGTMLDKWPFFATLALHVPVRERNDVKTVACDGQSLFYNAEWVAQAPADQLRAAVARVVLACSLKHHTRRGNRKYGRWQAASKIATLPFLRDAGLVDGNASGFGMDEAGLSVEQAYEMLDDDGECEEEGGGEGGEGGEGGAPGRPGSVDPDGKGEVMDAPLDGGGEKDGEGPPGEGSASGAGAGRGEGAESGASEERKREEQRWDERAHAARNVAKSVGKSSGFLDEAIEGMHENSVDWRVVLRRFMEAAAPADYSWSRPNRRHVADGLYLPSLRAEGMGPMVVAIDTSGSMGAEELDVAWTETWAAIAETKPREVTVIQCDAEVQSADVYGCEETPPLEFVAKGRGGTRVRPVFDHVDEHMAERPACLVYFSDMHVFDWEDEPDYPVLWVRPDVDGGYGEPERPPWGEYIEV